MLEIALLALASVLALAGAGLAHRRAREAAGAETVRSERHLRDDAIAGVAASVIMFAVMAIGHRRAGAIAFAAWSGGSCAFGALAAMGARAWRERVTRAAGAIGEQAIVIAVLGALTALAASAAHAFADPQRLATQVPEMVCAFAVGCAVQGMAERALPSVAAMVLASFFFDSNAGATLRSAPSYASALGFVLFPLAATALGAVGASVASIAWGSARSRNTDAAASLLALPAIAGAAIALLGWLWQPFALCGAIGVSMTLAPKLVPSTSERAREGVALIAIAFAAIASYAVAKHSGLAHAGPLGIAIAAIAAESAVLLERCDNTENLDGGDRQASALVALAVSLAVLDGATLFRCTRFADLAHAPTDDTAIMLAQCTIANVTPARIDIANPVTLSCALGALVLCVAVRPDSSLRSRVVTTTITVVTLVCAALAAHFLFGVGLEAVAAATLASSMGAALFPQACSRGVAGIIAASALALGAVVG